MNIVNKSSLAATLDRINEALFYDRPLLKAQRQEAAEWIASRQGLKGSYRGLFAPTTSDYKQGAKVFTGERVNSGAATGHILGEEASRALLLLDVHSQSVESALEHATSNMMEAVRRSDSVWGNYGLYCCGTCSVAYWRNLAAGGLKDPQSRLNAGMKALKAQRDGEGRWKRFPFYYTLLALHELDLPSARAEMRYAAPVLERVLKRKPRKDQISQRRRVLMERILDKC
jgi:hypothetical protein